MTLLQFLSRSKIMAFWRTTQLSIKRFNHKLYLALFIRMLMPTLYSTFRVYILGSLPDTSSVSIASQMAWVNILLEIVEEGLLQPLYYCLGMTLNNRLETRNKVKTGFIVCMVVYCTFSATISALASPLVTWMGQNNTLHDQTVDYVRLELIGIIASSMGKFLMLVMIMMEWNIALYIVLAIQMVSSITLDYVLVSEKVANLDVTGVALSSIGTSSLVFITCLIIVWIRLNFTWNDIVGVKYYFGWFRRWTRVGAYSALDSFIRNSVYLVVVLRAMNLLEEQDSYWVANNFIWSWLLLPALPLGDVIKQDIADAKKEPQPHAIRTSAAFAFSFILFAVWGITYPGWYPFVKIVLNANDPDLVTKLVTELIPFYAFFVLQIPLTSVFYALGKTNYLALCSFIGNIVLSLLYVLVFTGVLDETVFVVAGIFGGNLVVGFFIKFTVYARLIRQKSTF